jgi:hypothetical protein
LEAPRPAGESPHRQSRDLPSASVRYSCK